MPNHIINFVSFKCGKQKFKEMLESFQYDENEDVEAIGLGTIDFNKIIPMPENLNIEDGSTTYRAIELYLTSINPSIDYLEGCKIFPSEFAALVADLSKDQYFIDYDGHMSEAKIQDMKDNNQFEEAMALGKVAVDNFINYGAISWYDWRYKNWGTKWNSYYSGAACGMNDSGEISFWTANGAPHPIMMRLSELFPDVTIIHRWADEDIGNPDISKKSPPSKGMRKYLNGKLIDQEKFDQDAAARLWGYKDAKDYYGNE